MDPRYQQLADLLVRHSTKLEKGEHVLIEAFDIPVEMTIALIRAARFISSPFTIVCSLTLWPPRIPMYACIAFMR